MKKYILGGLIALLTITPVLAGVVVVVSVTSEDGKVWVGLTPDPCTNEKVLSFVPGPYKSQMQKAESIINGIPQAACFTVLPTSGMVVIQWDDGDTASIPITTFKDHSV